MKAFLPIIAATLAAALVWIVADHRARDVARQELDQTLLLTIRAVEAEVDRFRALPDIAAEDARIRAAFAGTGQPGAAKSLFADGRVHAGRMNCS